MVVQKRFTTFVSVKKKQVITIVAEKEVSAQDIQMVGMIAESMRAQDIAEKTGQNRRTIEARIATLKKKYQVSTPAGLVMLFYRNKLIS